MKIQDFKHRFLGSEIGLILKVLALSTLLSILIKQGGPTLSIPATTTVALTAALLPALLMGIALVWRGWQQGQ